MSVKRQSATAYDARKSRPNERGSKSVSLTRLGMWDDGAGDVINQETNYPNPDGDTVGSPNGLATSHTVRLFDKTTGIELASAEVSNGNSVVEGEFRYVSLSDAIRLAAGGTYALTMSTTALDGDLFHAPAPFSGNSPITSSVIEELVARRAAADGAYPTLLPNGSLATGDPSESVFAHRLFLGPTATLVEIVITPEMVDFNADGVVDGADFLSWQRGVGIVNPTHADGDADANGVVDGADLELWKMYLESNVPLAGGNPAGVVPEPASQLLALVGLALMGQFRRR